MKKREKLTLQQLIEKNKEELLKDSRVVDEIEARVEKKFQQNRDE